MAGPHIGFTNIGRGPTESPLSADSSPSLLISADDLILDTQINLDTIANIATIKNIVVSGGSGSYVYLWTATNGTFDDNTILDSSWTPTAGGIHSLKLTVTDDELNIAEKTFIVEIGEGVLTVSIASISNQLILLPIILDSTVTGGVGTKTYAWSVNGSTNGLSNATLADPVFTPSVSGIHIVICIVTDASGETATSSVSFTIGDGSNFLNYTTLSVDLIDID